MLEVGTQLGAYQISALIAAGGMGVVYRARHVHLGKEVALKVLASNLAASERVRRRFRQEAYFQSELEHPNIVRVTDFVLTKGQAAMVLELVRGPSLEQVLREMGPERWGYQRAMRLMVPVLEAVGYAHAHGLVHRDLKPANILLDRKNQAGGLGVPKVTDFGIAKMLGSDVGMTGTGAQLGTVPYMAPEQFEGLPKVDARADVFALAMVLYRLLTGGVPVNPESMKDVYGLYTGARKIPRLSKTRRYRLPPGVEAILADALSLCPDDRPADATELLAELKDSNAETAQIAVNQPLSRPEMNAAKHRAKRAARQPDLLDVKARPLVKGVTRRTGATIRPKVSLTNKGGKDLRERSAPPGNERDPLEADSDQPIIPDSVREATDARDPKSGLRIPKWTLWLLVSALTIAAVLGVMTMLVGSHGHEGNSSRVGQVSGSANGSAADVDLGVSETEPDPSRGHRPPSGLDAEAPSDSDPIRGTIAPDERDVMPVETGEQAIAFLEAYDSSPGVARAEGASAEEAPEETATEEPVTEESLTEEPVTEESVPEETVPEETVPDVMVFDDEVREEVAPDQQVSGDDMTLLEPLPNVISTRDELLEDARRLGIGNRNEEAVALLEDARALDPRHAPVHLMLYTNYARLGDDRSAADALDEYLTLRPDSPDADRYREILSELGRVHYGTVSAFEPGVGAEQGHEIPEAEDPGGAQDPAEAEPAPEESALDLVDEARRLGVRGRYREAVELLVQARELNPNYDQIYLILYGNYERLGHRDDAAEALEEYLRRSPDANGATEYRQILHELREED